MDTALPQKIPFILDRNLAKANCTGNHVCTSCDKVVLDIYLNILCLSFQIHVFTCIRILLLYLNILRLILFKFTYSFVFLFFALHKYFM